MGIPHLEIGNIASKTIKLNEITTIKCSRTALCNSWTRSFLTSVAQHYLQQHSGNVLLALHHYEFEDKVFKKILSQEGVCPYLIERKHTLHQLDCYLERLREEGTEIKFVIISQFDSFIHKCLTAGHGRISWKRDEAKKETAELMEGLRLLSAKFGCRFLLRGSVKTIPGISMEVDYAIYSAQKIPLSQREKLPLPNKQLNLFKITIWENELKTTLYSIRDDLNQGILYYPPSLKLYLE